MMLEPEIAFRGEHAVLRSGKAAVITRLATSKISASVRVEDWLLERARQFDRAVRHLGHVRGMIKFLDRNPEGGPTE